MVQIPAIRVAIDAHVAGTRKTGNETYVVNLADAMVRRDDVDPIVYVNEGARWPGDPATAPHLRSLRFSAPQLRIPVELPYRIRRDRACLLHVQYVAPPILSVPVVVAIHDVSFEDVDGIFPAATQLRLRATVRLTARRSARILVLSEFTKSRIVHHYGVAPERIVVAPGGVGRRWQPLAPSVVHDRLAGLSLPEQFILVVGNLHPRKNVPRLIRAVDRVRRSGATDVGLIIAGQPGWHSGEVDHAIEQTRGSDWIRRIGYVSDDTLVALNNAATVVAYPSLYEGFGLPVIEGLACGAVVVASSTTSIPEVAGEAAILVDPHDDASVAAGIERAIADDSLRGVLRAAGPERARMFTWDACGEATARAYHEALTEGSPPR